MLMGQSLIASTNSQGTEQSCTMRLEQMLTLSPETPQVARYQDKGLRKLATVCTTVWQLIYSADGHAGSKQESLTAQARHASRQLRPPCFC